MKKVLFFFYALAFAFVFSSCEELGELTGDKVEIESPYTDIIVSDLVCEGYDDGSVYIDFNVVSTEADLSVYFGDARAYANDRMYTASAIGTLDLVEDEKVAVQYWGDENFLGEYSYFENIPTSLSSFEEIEVAIIVDGIEEVEYIKFKNVAIDWQ